MKFMLLQAYGAVESHIGPMSTWKPEEIDAHIQFQLDNLMTYDLVAKGVSEGRVNVHGWLYEMEEGELVAYDPASGEWRGLLEFAGG